MSKKLLFNFNREVIQNYTYVKYVGTIITATNTLEKPIKSAILKGRTLVNLVPQNSGSFNGTRFLRIPLSSITKANTSYFVKFNLRESSLTNGVTCRLKNTTTGRTMGGLKSDGIITVDGDGYNIIEFYITNANDVTNGLSTIVDDIMVIEYQDDMENWDIPCFEGMQSVEMPVLTTSNYKNLANDIFIDYGYNSDGTIDNQKKWLISDFISIEPNVSYTTRSQGATNDGVFAIAFYDKVKTFINKKVTNNAISPTNAKFARINVRKRNGLDVTEEEKNDTILYLEKTTEVLPFESHKTNILTVNEDLELRGIGDIKDELDCLTGEVIERIGEVVLDGSEDEKLSLRLSHGLVYQGVLYNNNYISNHQLKNIYSNKIERFCIIIPSTITSISEARQWLSENNVIIQLPLAEESIKTVDLSILDQNGNKVSSISSFNDTTHIKASSETIPPIFEGYLATKEVE